jgi:hypothetical protein
MAEFSKSLSTQTAAALAGLTYFVLLFAAANGVAPHGYDMGGAINRFEGAFLAFLVAPAMAKLNQ